MSQDTYALCCVCGESTRHRIGGESVCRARACRVSVLGTNEADADSRAYLTGHDADEDGIGDHTPLPARCTPLLNASIDLPDLDCTCNPSLSHNGRCVNCDGLVDE